MEKDPRRRALGSVADVAELVKARDRGRIAELEAGDVEPFPATGQGWRRLGRFPGQGLGWRKRAGQPAGPPPRRNVGQAQVVTISGALVLMPPRPLRGIRPPMGARRSRTAGTPGGGVI